MSASDACVYVDVYVYKTTMKRCGCDGGVIMTESVIQLTGECDGWKTEMTTEKRKWEGSKGRLRGVVGKVRVFEGASCCIATVVSLKTLCELNILTRDALGGVVYQELLINDVSPGRFGLQTWKRANNLP